MIKSKLTTKAQTTVPQAVRTALRLKAGDELAYALAGDHVIVTKAEAASVDDPFATFAEWSGEDDEKAYASL